mmetsp:Transcript_44833/g.104700  ORF Transcript_44833/g.104700 Transcript_44833/m.104700 type:complete len:828 (-) Transcript_44833:166-2649(-)|eukprot:s1477_g11.t1
MAGAEPEPYAGVDMVHGAIAVKEQFQLFDDNETGTIGKEDLRSLIQNLGHFDPDEIDRILNIAVGDDGNEIMYESFIDWAFNSAKVIEHRKDRLRNVKLFQNFGELEIEECAKVLELVTYAAGQDIITQGDEGFDCFIVDAGECFAKIQISGKWKEVVRYEPGGFFGERALLRKEPRAATVTARTDVKLLRLSREEFVSMIAERDHKENLIRKIKEFDTFNDLQVATLAGAFERRWFEDNETIFKQGDEGHHFYLLEDGECVATEKDREGNEHEVRRYQHGELFGEKAMTETSPRPATVRAVGTVKVLQVSREDFEKKLGPLIELKAQAYKSDPRKLISDFYQPGDSRGPGGSRVEGAVEIDVESRWFVVYRPCSRDSIAKMLGKVGVGKGLNVKGKSAKKNRLSGFVPFIQISDNRHKWDVEESPKDTRTKIFYRSKAAREQAHGSLTKVIKEAKLLRMDDPNIKVITDYEPITFGLDVPEPLMREAYIMKPDLSPMVGWETGRQSEPAFMDMNLHAVRGDTSPEVVLYQYDLADPMNPLGLLVAYAEAHVLPVVSDFDTFLVGSTNVAYDPLPPKQQEMFQWCLEHTADIIGLPASKGWTSRWLEVLKEEASKKGFHPEIPKLGFGDDTSVRLIGDVVKVTASCGAIRHGAECFNFYFPQELDDEFLVIWDGYQDPPWRPLKEAELRKFLMERADEGYCFPLNPVWPIRDQGWYEVLDTLRKRQDPQIVQNLQGWFSEEALKRIDEIHLEFPDGFSASAMKRAGSTVANLQDFTGEEMADFAREEVRKVVKARWKRIRESLLMLARIMAEMDDEEHAKMLGGDGT